ncbi:MFS transporter [Vagococcus humatus]|uniref:Major facilitator superfamily (MFS) profile domain-containing protein n=1 Tax=Vagococcus humatus TaxID=1889241 RepID=A0A3R9YWS1_9ENTE|nr:MFS transporter [Vagococcus humatus]RST89161.1 hypothetical protein C7P63_05120 [Vagococcus humatus]
MSFYKELSRQQKYILICCFFIFFVNGLYAMVFGSLLPYLRAEYGLNEVVSGMLISGHQAGNLLGGFIAGVLPLYFGEKRSIMFLSIFVMIGFYAMTVTGNHWILLISFFFTGISRGSISNFNNRTVNNVSGSSPVAMNFLHSLFAVGALLSPFLIIVANQIVGDKKGWKVACYVIIALILFSQFLFYQMKLPKESTQLKKDNQGKQGFTFMKDQFFWLTVGILFFYLCAEAAITGWLVTYFIEANILSTSQAQMISSVLWIGILIGRLGCIFFGDRVRRGKLLFVISLLSVVFYFLLLASTNGFTILWIVLGLGASMGGIYPTAMTIAGKSIEKHPMALGWILVIGGLGGILMPMLTGVLASQYGIQTGMSAIVVSIILMFLGVVWHNRLEKKQMK